MKPRNVLGLVLLTGDFVAFWSYAHAHELTAVAGVAFLGAAMVAGLVADFDHVAALAVSLLKTWRGQA